MARDGEILAADCGEGTVVVRPWGDGEGDTYPPPLGEVVPAGFLVVYAYVNGEELRVNVTRELTTVPSNPVYNRFVGTAEGTFGGETFTGVSFFEQIKSG